MTFIQRIDIPEDKAATVARLDAMRRDGWAALDSMSEAELAALEGEVDGAMVVNMSVDHPHAVALQDARRAIKHRRSAFRRGYLLKHTAQSDRYKNIVYACSHIRKATELLDKAHEVAPDPNLDVNRAPEPFRPIDVTVMSDAELAQAIRVYEAELHREPPADFCVVAQLRTPAAKAIAAELKDRQEAFDALVASARINVDAARRELARRKKEEAERAERVAEIQANLTAVVADLQGRIADLEAGK